MRPLLTVLFIVSLGYYAVRDAHAQTSPTYLPIFDIDEAGGVLIGVAIFGLWALAWVIRQLLRMVNERDDDGHGA